MQAQSGSNQLIDVEIVSSKHLVPIILEHLKSLQQEQSFLLSPVPTCCCCIRPELCK